MKSMLIMKDQRGMAMVLTISLIGLLTLFGLWMIRKSSTALQITTSMTRNEMAFNRAEGAMAVGLGCLKNNPPDPNLSQLIYNAKTRINLCSEPQYTNLQETATQSLLTNLYFLGWDPNPPPGWILNRSGYANRSSWYYLSNGEAKAAQSSNPEDSRKLIDETVIRVK